MSAPFVLAHPAAPLLTDPLWRSLAVNAVLFLAPGLALHALLSGRRPRAARLLPVMAVAVATFMAVTVAARLFGAGVKDVHFWNATWLITVAAAVLHAFRGGAPGFGVRRLRPRHARGGLLFAAAYLVVFLGATHVVPATADHDFELQGTAHALLADLTPRVGTTRGTSHYFAHPPLAHVFVAASFLYQGRWDDLAAYDTLPPPEAPEFRARLDALFERYLAAPHRVETRTPNVFLAAAAVTRLGAWAMATAGTGIGALLAAAFLLTPEAFVRFSYGGYFALGTFVLVELALLEERGGLNPRRLRTIRFLAGLGAALADHKLVVVLAALAAWQSFRKRPGGGRGAVRAAATHPAVLGFLAGTVAFWIYGLSVNAPAFLTDHVRHHLVDRVLHRNPWNTELDLYPSVGALWTELLRDTGTLFLPLAVAALVLIARRRHGPATTGFWMAWVVLVGVVFSVVDWRQTKHLVLLLPVLVLAPARAARLSRAARIAVLLAILVVLVLDLRLLALLASDFDALAKAPEW